MTPNVKQWVGFISIALAMASCSPIVDTRGHNDEAADMKQIISGQSSAEDVMALLGSPTTTASFGEETWYYVTQKKERVGIFAPETVEQHVMAIHFDSARIVTEVSEYTKDQGKPVQMVSKTTPTEGHDMTIIEQMLGNMGRFNAPARGVSSRNMGR